MSPRHHYLDVAFIIIIMSLIHKSVVELQNSMQFQSLRQSLRHSSVPKTHTANREHRRRFQTEDGELRLPRIQGRILNESEKDIVNFKILRMKRLSYDPTGCSKSIKLEKVLLRKKINRRPPVSYTEPLKMPLRKHNQSKELKNSVDENRYSQPINT